MVAFELFVQVSSQVQVGVVIGGCELYLGSDILRLLGISNIEENPQRRSEKNAGSFLINFILHFFYFVVFQFFQARGRSSGFGFHLIGWLVLGTLTVFQAGH